MKQYLNQNQSGMFIEIVYVTKDIDVENSRGFMFEIFSSKWIKKLSNNLKISTFLRLYLFFTRSVSLYKASISYLALGEILNKKISELTEEEVMRLSILKLLVSREKTVTIIIDKSISVEVEDVLLKVLISKAYSGKMVALHTKKAISNKYVVENENSFYHQISEV